MPRGGRIELGSAPWHRPALGVAVLLVFFGLLELALTVAGFRPPADAGDPPLGFAGGAPLFTRVAEGAGSGLMRTSPQKLKFFNYQEFPERKHPGTYRIFCVGGSTTYGRPFDDRTSFAGWLRELLPEADRTRNWEVINAGGISYASYRIANLMAELADYGPDLFVVYSGHNEFLEERTYGDLRRTPGFLRSAAALLARTSTGAAFGALVGKGELRIASSSQTGGTVLPGEVQAKLDRSAGLELYSRDDELRDAVLAHFELSLERMVHIARDSGAELILVTPASNLKDFSPFKSQHTERLGASQREETVESVQAARAAEPDGDLLTILEDLESALAHDERYAELHYRRGRILLAMGRVRDADRAFRRARDEDVCPLRALSSAVDIVREVADESNATLVDFVDMVARVSAQTTGYAIAGDEAFLDHVHPTIAAHRRLAVELISAMADTGIVTLSEDWGAESISSVAERVEAGLDRHEQARALANLAMTLSWAGKDEYSVRKAEQALALGLDDPQFSPTILAIVARQRALDGQPEEALAHYRRAVRANPGNADIHMQTGMFLASRDEEAAVAHLFLASLIWSGNDETHRQLAWLQQRRGRPGSALRSLMKVRELVPEDDRLVRRIAELSAVAVDTDRMPRELSAERYPSGSARLVFEVRSTQSGEMVRDGVWTEWSQAGDLIGFAEYAGGVPVAAPVRWNGDGRRLAAAGLESSG